MDGMSDPDCSPRLCLPRLAVKLEESVVAWLPSVEDVAHHSKLQLNITSKDKQGSI